MRMRAADRVLYILGCVTTQFTLAVAIITQLRLQEGHIQQGEWRVQLVDNFWLMQPLIFA